MSADFTGGITGACQAFIWIITFLTFFFASFEVGIITVAIIIDISIRIFYTGGAYYLLAVLTSRTTHGTIYYNYNYNSNSNNKEFSVYLNRILY